LTIRRFIESELRPLEDKVEETGEFASEDAARIFVRSKDLGSYAIASGANVFTKYAADRTFRHIQLTTNLINASTMTRVAE